MQDVLDLSMLNEKTLQNVLTKEVPLEINEEVLKGQENFLNTTVGKAVNFGLDVGLKALQIGRAHV